MSPARDRRVVVLAALTGVAGTAISMTGSGNASLWGDEAASALSAQRPLSSLLTMLQTVDAVHGLYYLGLHLWIDVFGASPFSMRAPSAIGIGVTVAGLVSLGYQLRGPRFGVLAGIVGAVLPRLTDVGSEARSFAWTAAIAVWLTGVFVLAVKRRAPRRTYWVGYGALLALGIILFIWMALLAVAHLMILLVARAGPERAVGLVRGWAIAAGAAVVAASPVLLFAFLERDQISYLETRQTYDVTSLFVTPWFENPGVAIVAWVLITGGIALSARAVTRGGAGAGDRAARALLLIPVAWMLAPAVILLGASPLIAVYTPRYLAFCAPAVALLIAIPIEAMLRSRRRVEAGVAVGILLAAIAPVWVAQRGPYAKNESDWAQISANIATRAHPGDAIAFDDSVRPSRRPRLAMRTYPAGFTGLADPTLETPFARNTTWYDATYTLAQAEALGRLDGVTRIWLVEYAISGRADTAGIGTLRAGGFHQVSVIHDHRSDILEFVRAES